MTLQQAVFAGIVDPGQLVAVRSLGTTDVPPADVGHRPSSAAPVPATTITKNANGSVTVSDAAGAALDGTDTLWNIEVLRFCNNFDKATRACLDTVPADVLVSTLGPAAPANAVVTPAGTLGFGIVTVGTGPLRARSPSPTRAAARRRSPAPRSPVSRPRSSPSLNNGCTTLGAGGSCTIDVGFSPTTAGLLRTATLVIATSAGNRNVDLTGTAIAAAILGAGEHRRPDRLRHPPRR